MKKTIISDLHFPICHDSPHLSFELPFIFKTFPLYLTLGNGFQVFTLEWIK